MKTIWFLALIGLADPVQAAPMLDVRLYKTTGAASDSINVRIENTTNQPVPFKYLSLQQLINDQWTMVIYDSACPCLAKCNTATTIIEPKKIVHLVFNFKQLGCGVMTQGAKYRAIIQGNWDKKANSSVRLGVSAPFIARE